VAVPLVPVTLLAFMPDAIRFENLIWAVPYLLCSTVLLPMWRRAPYGLDSWATRAIQGWANAFALFDVAGRRLLGRWPAGATRRRRRFWIWFTAWGLGSVSLCTALAFWRMLTGYPPDYVLLFVVGVFGLVVVGRVMVRPTRFTPVATPARGWERHGVQAATAMGQLTQSGEGKVRLGRILLVPILLCQALLSLRLRNSTNEDEALYIWAGHLELDSILHGTSLANFGFQFYFSGAPQLYPVLAAVLDNLGGLFLVRLGSCLMMVATTGLLYSISRKIFNVKIGLWAAVLFASLQSTQFLGNYATFDALALFLLTLATWLGVMAGGRRFWWALPVIPVLGLATTMKYASAMFIPTVVVVAGLVTVQRRGSWVQGIVRAAGLGIGSVAASYGGLELTGVFTALQATTTERPHGIDRPLPMIYSSLEWSGVVFVVALLGSVLFVIRSGQGELRGRIDGSTPGRTWRLFLALTLVGTACLAPAYQIRLATMFSLNKHVGYGLMFTCVLAGVGMSRLVGRHVNYPQIGILVAAAGLVLGMAQSSARMATWPDSAPMIKALSNVVTKGDDVYMVEEHEIAAYYLRDKVNSDQFVGVYYIIYQRKGKPELTGTEGYTAAINDGYYKALMLRSDISGAAGNGHAIRVALDYSGRYRLATTIPYPGHSAYELWVRN
jgi:4-amino-4-deoxy-L-arabinose transferase-like glycosyltransferase